MDKFKKWIIEDDEYEDNDNDVVDEANKKTRLFDRAKAKYDSNPLNKDGQLVLFEPKTYSDAQEIADYLKQRRATIVNLHRLDKAQAKRVVDFLTGVIYAIEGDIQRIGPMIFLCTPKNIGVSGSITMDEDVTQE